MIKNTRAEIEKFFKKKLNDTRKISTAVIQEVQDALNKNSTLTDGEFLHLLMNMACLLAKEDKSFYYYRSAFITFVLKTKPDDVEMFAGDGDDVVFVQSKFLGTTTFHHNPGKIEREFGYTYLRADFEWSGFRRQEMAIDEALDPALRSANIEKSQPIPLKTA